MQNVKKLLESHRHQVSLFSVDWEQNDPSTEKEYFAEPPGDRTKAFYSDLDLSLTKSIKFAVNTVYSLSAKNKVKKLISILKPDIAYAISIQNYLSPSVLDGCREMGLPVAHRISDFGIICSRYTFLRDGEICEKCYDSIFNAIRYSCGGHEISLKKAMVRAIGIYYWRHRKIYERSVNVFITPTQFMKEKLIKWGFEKDKIVHIPTFTDSINSVKSESISKKSNEKFVLYFGRISYEKGLMILLKAYERLNRQDLKLILAGSSTTGYLDELKTYVKERKLKGVEFIGHQGREKLNDLISKARMTVLPSIWYENMPNSVIESFSAGTPVIASRLGSLPELIEDGVNGLLFESGNPADLADKMSQLLNNDSLANGIGKAGKKKAEDEYTAETHYSRLLAVFKSLTKIDKQNSMSSL